MAAAYRLSGLNVEPSSLSLHGSIHSRARAIRPPLSLNINLRSWLATLAGSPQRGGTLKDDRTPIQMAAARRSKKAATSRSRDAKSEAKAARSDVLQYSAGPTAPVESGRPDRIRPSAFSFCENRK